jgi:hypothetical protein
MRKRVRGPDGTTWRVGRRWLPWRPRRRAGVATPWVDGLEFAGADDAVGCLVAVAVAVLLPVIVLAVMFALEWLALAAVLPVAVAARAITGRPWIVTARPLESVGVPGHGGHLRYAYAVRGWPASRRAIETARRDIGRTGVPESLGTGTPLRSRSLMYASRRSAASTTSPKSVAGFHLRVAPPLAGPQPNGSRNRLRTR